MEVFLNFQMGLNIAFVLLFVITIYLVGRIESGRYERRSDGKKRKGEPES